MKKFNYIKWKSQTLPGLLNEQWSGYNNVPFVTCFACIGGQIHATQSDSPNLINSTPTPNTGSAQGHCGWTTDGQDWYTTQGALNAVSGSCGGGVGTNIPTCYSCHSGSQVTGPSEPVFPNGGYTGSNGACYMSSSLNPFTQWGSVPGNIDPNYEGGYGFPWVTSYTNCTGSLTTGSYQTGSQTVCHVSNPALALLTPNPQMGDPGISSQFVNNMAGRSINFYQNKANNLQGRLSNLQTTGQYCRGENPRRQARIKNKITSITSCSNNPGTC